MLLNSGAQCLYLTSWVLFVFICDTSSNFWFLQSYLSILPHDHLAQIVLHFCWMPNRWHLIGRFTPQVSLLKEIYFSQVVFWLVEAASMVLSSFIIITIVSGMHIYLLFSLQYTDPKSIEDFEFLAIYRIYLFYLNRVLFSTNQCSP